MSHLAVSWLLLLSTGFGGGLARGELRGDLSFATTGFFDNPSLTEQDSHTIHPSTALSLFHTADLDDDLVSTLALFGRYNPFAEDPLTGDIREANLSFYGETTTLRMGIINEFWGVLETENIVDIINQRDYIESYEGDVKLGQLGLQLTIQHENANVGFYLLPFLRERRFAEGSDRLRSLPLNLSAARFDHQRHLPGFAARSQFFFDNLELAVSHYGGYSREPQLTLAVDPTDFSLSLVPNYAYIQQSSVDMQWILGETIFKTELFQRWGEKGDGAFFGLGTGVENEINNIFDTRASITPFLELYYDNRSSQAPLTAFDNDIVVGTRVALNDVAGSVLELSLLYDWETKSAIVDLEAQRRLNQAWVFSLKGALFINTANDPALNNLGDDSFLRFELSYFF